MRISTTVAGRPGDSTIIGSNAAPAVTSTTPAEPTVPGHDDRTDQELIERANRGDAAAFEALYRRYRDWVAGLALRFTGDRDDALDVLQETFAYFFAKFPGFELTSAVKTFLYPTIKHLSLDRRRRRRPSVDVDELADVLPAPTAETSSDLDRLLGLLPDAQRDVVMLRFADDLSLAQIAKALGIPLGTVKSRLHGAIETLRRVLRS